MDPSSTELTFSATMGTRRKQGWPSQQGSAEAPQPGRVTGGHQAAVPHLQLPKSLPRCSPNIPGDPTALPTGQQCPEAALAPLWLPAAAAAPSGLEGLKLCVFATSSGQGQSPQPGNPACATGMALGWWQQGWVHACQGKLQLQGEASPFPRTR